MEPAVDSSDQQFCDFIAGLDLIQLGRLITNGSQPEIGFEIIDHLRSCSSEGCVKIGEAWHELQDGELQKLWDVLPEEEKRRRIFEGEAAMRQRTEDRRLNQNPIVRIIENRSKGDEDE